MNQEKIEKLEEYFHEAGSWSADRQEASRRSLRLTSLVAGVLAFVVVAEAIALIALTPLKTVVPYALLVDRQTGYVQALDPVKGEQIAPTAALTRSFLVQYVIARESFMIDALQQNYRKTALWSDGDVRRGYVAQMQASNPQSPLTLYPRRTVIGVQVKSVSMVDKDTALVRFATLREDQGGQPRPDRSWIATISFRYSGEPMTVEDRLINPLGFLVTRYSKDVEILPESRPEPAAAPARVPVVVEGAPTTAAAAPGTDGQ